MPLLVVGSVAYDSIKTPRGDKDNILGGSAVYFSLAAKVLAPVRLVGVVGEDFESAHVDFLNQRNVDIAGLESIPGGRTFRWTGEYSPDMNSRETLSVQLNVLEDFEPKIPDSFRDSRFIFLANGPIVTQLSVLEQVKAPQFVMADTMDLWIQTQRQELFSLLKRVNGLLLNDSEALLLTDQHNVVEAGRAILELGPEVVVIKKGEHGALLFQGDKIVPMPAYPLGRVMDPTGAGDSFAGGLMGHLARSGTVDEKVLKQALAYGTVAASFTVEDFGVDRIAALDTEQVQERFEDYRAMLSL